MSVRVNLTFEKLYRSHILRHVISIHSVCRQNTQWLDLIFKISKLFQLPSHDSSLTAHLSLRACLRSLVGRWFSIENSIEKCFEVMRLIQLSISFMFSFLFCIAQSRSIGRNQSPKLWGLGLFLCLRKLQKRFLHAKQTVSLVLCSIFLSSPLFCFPNSIKNRPFSNFSETWSLVAVTSSDFR